MAFSKAKTKSAIHGATFSGIKKKKVKQQKTLKFPDQFKNRTSVYSKTKRGEDFKNGQVKQMVIKKPTQFKTQTKKGFPGQKYEARIARQTQKKTMSDAQLTARLRAVTGSTDPC